MPDAQKTPKAKHPGRTIAQRRVLDAIGCGNHSPGMGGVLRNMMIEEGLIVKIADRVFGTGWSAVRIEQFDMPVAVHMQWCDAVAKDAPDGE